MKRETGTRGRTVGLLGIAVVVMVFSISVLAGAEEPKPGTIAFKPTIAALFKNGLGFFVCDGEGTVEQGTLVSDFIPDAAFGAFWLASRDPDVVVTSARAALREVKKPVGAASLVELLRANAGEKVSLLFGNEWMYGVILPPPGADPVHGEAPPDKESSMVLLETHDGRHVALNTAEIKRVDFSGEFKQTLERTQHERRLSIFVETEKPTAPLQMSFLQKGITWVPSYNVDIADEKKARISMQAIVVNEALDMEGAEIYFIVGYPNLQYADTLTPLSIQQSLAQLIQSLSQPTDQRRRYSPMSQIAVMSNAAFIGDGNFDVPTNLMGYSTSVAAGLEGTHEEDLYFYSLKDYSLKKGERGYINLFSGEADYKHIYTWSVPRTIEEQQSSRTEDNTQKDEVWHCVKLKNSTPYPWTTGAAFTSRGWKPLGQDTLRYTPKGGETNLRITQVTDIRVSRKEVETQRQKRALQFYGSDWDLVTVKGEFVITSYKQEPIEMEITKQLLGEVQETTDNGAVTKRAEGLQAVNPKSEIKWNITLKPGEEKTISYIFNIYVR
jgi:hypothetical protein